MKAVIFLLSSLIVSAAHAQSCPAGHCPQGTPRKLVTSVDPSAGNRGELVIMKKDGDTFYPQGREKIVVTTGGNPGGPNSTVIVNILTKRTMCQVFVSNLSEAMAIVGAVGAKTTFECYVNDDGKVSGGRVIYNTTSVSIVK